MGRGRKDWKFLHKMAGCLGQNPKVNPAFTFDASSESQASRSESLSATSSSTNNENCSDCSDEGVGDEIKRERN